MPQENLERNFGFILNDVARLLRTVYDRRVRSLGLTRAQWWVLTHLYRADGVTQAELAETLEIERATLGRLLDRLEAKGWVRRETDAEDRRAKRVHLTEAVREPMRTMRAVAAGVRADALAGLSEEEQDRFVDLMLRVKGNLLALDDSGPGNSGNSGNSGKRAGRRGAP